ncbi:GATA-type zinc finger transcription factor [Phycomyces blakesleeanus]|uniref:GATA-type zinc finger transcription factor n=2 Tax=Phycomyces blakesleeanus TaxID=4837 RepID=A0A167PA57_PHYB8|nr:GATA-type zinc finger transcription factor [Phycomyces blakesleeanus NRRL 1555(-)]OAD77551.1 GATA-type zinc finger transcription factor [Phycomyces blakesleeanus NRRL 1555(-)]|eukprot:XP_018295591.1 GATA-type zinc finger transcription factor [Phycomyces blakesleeanus NRRL 1555(-)]
MPLTTCFWALLSLNELSFIYLPASVGDKEVLGGRTIRDLLLNRSLLDFVHHEEVDLAKSDLSTFVRMKTLAGSVTRCRLRSFADIALCIHRSKDLSQPCAYNAFPDKDGHMPTISFNGETKDKEATWDVIDVVMYTASENVVLAFFHSTEYFHSQEAMSTLCGESIFREQDIQQMMDVLQKYSYDDLVSSNSQLEKKIKEPLRVFQIYNSTSHELLASWPPHFDSNCDTTPSSSGSGSGSSSGNHRPPSNPIPYTFLRDACVPQLISKVTELTKNATLRDISGDERQGVEEVACTHHLHSSSMVHLGLHGMVRFERIVIPYGVLSFGSHQITQINHNSTTDLGQYHHYMHCAPSTIPDDTTYLSGVISNPNSTAVLHRPCLSEPHSPVVVVPDPALTPLYHPALPSPTISPSLAINPHRHRPFGRQSEDPPPSGTNSPVTLAYPMSLRSPEPSPIAPKIPISTISPKLPAGHVPEERQWLHVRSLYDPILDQQTAKVCVRCNTSSSPEWRRGPNGHKTLCNACGLRYSRLLSKQWRKSELERYGPDGLSKPTKKPSDQKDSSRRKAGKRTPP